MHRMFMKGISTYYSQSLVKGDTSMAIFTRGYGAKDLRVRERFVHENYATLCCFPAHDGNTRK